MKKILEVLFLVASVSFIGCEKDSDGVFNNKGNVDLDFEGISNKAAIHYTHDYYYVNGWTKKRRVDYTEVVGWLVPENVYSWDNGTWTLTQKYTYTCSENHIIKADEVSFYNGKWKHNEYNFTSDDNGRMTSKIISGETFAKIHKYEYQYDGKGNLQEYVSWVKVGSGDFESPYVISYVYNTNNQLYSKIFDSNNNYRGSTRHYYNSRGNLLEAIDYDYSGKETAKVSYQYDSQGNQISHSSFKKQNEVLWEKVSEYEVFDTDYQEGVLLRQMRYDEYVVLNRDDFLLDGEETHLTKFNFPYKKAKFFEYPDFAW